MTFQGEDFVERRLTVPKYAVLYDGKLLRLEGEHVNIHAVLPKGFDYHALMRGIFR